MNKKTPHLFLFLLSLYTLQTQTMDQKKLPASKTKKKEKQPNKRPEQQSKLNQQLINAIQKNNLNKAQELIDKGANVNNANTNTDQLLSNRYQPIHIAVKNNNKKMLSLLLKNNADVNQVSNFPKHYEGNGDVIRPLDLAVIEGFTDIVQLLIAHKAHTTSLHDGKTSLDWAAQLGHTPIVNALLSAKFQHTDRPLNMAAANGHIDTVKTLLDVKANIENIQEMGVPDKNDCWHSIKTTPLLIASNNGKPETVLFLIKAGANIEATPDHDSLDTPLIAATRNNHTVITKILIDAKADVNKSNKKGETPLLWACFNGKKNTAHFLLLAGADVNKKNNDGDTPFALAALNGNTDLMKLLLQYKANPSTSNITGMTALHYAAYRVQRIALTLLLNHPQCKNMKKNQVINEGAFKNKTAVDIAIDNFHTLKKALTQENKNNKYYKDKMKKNLEIIYILLLNNVTTNSTSKQDFKELMNSYDFDKICKTMEHIYYTY